MAVSIIDWERCNRDLTDGFPQIEADLKEGIDGICRESFGYSIYLKNPPPHIRVVFHAETSTDEKALKKARPLLADVLKNIAVKYGLKAKISVNPGRGGFVYEEKTYTLKPDFQEYREN